MSIELESAMSTARTLVTELASETVAPCSQRGPANLSCISAEEHRELTKAEADAGWVQRPYWAYDQSRMCLACAAYWHAQRCEQILHEYRCLAVKTAAKSRPRV